MDNAENTAADRKAFRDTRAAQLARLEPEKVRTRKSMAVEMLRQGMSRLDVQEATKRETGTAIGCGTLSRIKRALDKEAAREARRQMRAAASPKPKVRSEPTKPATTGGLPATAELLSALVGARVPFEFDGTSLLLKVALHG